MFGSTFGHLFRLTSFGESHGAKIGGIIDGCPSGLALDEAVLQKELDLRRPGGSAASTPRNEADAVSILSGVYKGLTTGTAIAFEVQNKDAHSADYDELANIFRPGHADYSYTAKYHHRDPRGGGRSSGRETIARVAGGAIAKTLLRRHGLVFNAYTLELGGIAAERTDVEGSAQRAYFAPNDDIIAQWDKLVADTIIEGDTIGGIVELVVHNVPPGLGEPVFGKLDAMIAAGLMSVGAVKGIEIGSGFACAKMKGSEHNDSLRATGFASNNAGGILGGISSGQDIVVRVAVKPIPSVGVEQKTLRRDGSEAIINIGGRHDICAIPRIVPVLKAMLALVLADALLMQKRMTDCGNRY